MTLQVVKLLITDDQFIATFKSINAATSSSPSGHHVGHYKAILDHPAIVQMHTTMLSIPLQIISLKETNSNQGTSNIIAQQLGFLLEDDNLVSPM